MGLNEFLPNPRLQSSQHTCCDCSPSLFKVLIADVLLQLPVGNELCSLSNKNLPPFREQSFHVKSTWMDLKHIIYWLCIEEMAMGCLTVKGQPGSVGDCLGTVTVTPPSPWLVIVRSKLLILLTNLLSVINFFFFYELVKLLYPFHQQSKTVYIYTLQCKNLILMISITRYLLGRIIALVFFMRNLNKVRKMDSSASCIIPGSIIFHRNVNLQ